MIILVTGGAGYIGSLVAKKLLDLGHQVLIIDNLSTGFIEGIDNRAIFYEGDIRDFKFVENVFREHSITHVMDFAAKLDVAESFQIPEEYYDVNVFGLSNVLKAMNKYDVKNIVFSSTAAVYGLLDKGSELINEEDPTIPCNPYGDTKLNGEQLIKYSANVNELNYIIFRYFNVIGGTKPGASVDYFTTILPKIIASIKNGKQLTINGDDYNTPDGTCIRDYIHVEDLANAHINAVLNMNTENTGIYNLSVGRGTSILELIKVVERNVGKEVSYNVGPRRSGDPVTSAATNEKFLKNFNWNLRFADIDEMISSACKEYLD